MLNQLNLNRRLGYFLFLIVISLTLQSCEQDDDNDGVPNKKDKCKDTPLNTAVDKNGCPIIEKEIGAVHFYIETSASMGGYFKQDAEYKTIVSDLTTKIDKGIKPIDIWLVADTVIQYTKHAEQLSSDFATTRIADQKSSELHKIIAKISEKNDSNDVTLLVSDCILSFPDKDIKTNPEINREEAPNTLKNNIYSTFADLKKKGLATSIYAFNSRFYGTYYNYQNGKIKLNGDVRPFYLWVIANKEILDKFNSKLHDIGTFKPEKSLHFGLNEEPVTTYKIIPQIERIGNWMKSSEGLKGIEIKQSEELQFCAALNLENLPEYTREISYLEKNLVVEGKGCVVDFEVKDKSKVDKSKLKSQPQIEDLESSTDVIIFKLKEMELAEANIYVRLPLNYDTWYLDWSCPDDKILSKINGKTFALEHLIAGVKEAYETKNKDYINFSIKLTK